MEKITNEEKALIASQTLYFGSGALAAVFLSIYLFKLGGFPAVTLFYFLTYFLIVAVYMVSGFMLKKTSTKTLIIAALVMFTFFWALLYLLKQSAITYLIPLGILFGVAGGFYWSGVNLTQYVVSHESRRNSYFGWVSAWANIARGLGPVLGGFIIFFFSRFGMDGYSFVFLTVLVINLFNLYAAFGLPEHSGVVFSLRHFMTHKRTPFWNRVLKEQFLLGLWDVSVSTLFGVILYIILTNELAVGTTNAIQSLIAAGGAGLAPVILKKFPKSPLIAGIISGLGLAVFAQLQTVLGLLILTICTIFAFQIVTVPLMSSVLTGIDKNPQSWQHKYHMLIERDAVLGLARSLSFILLWLAFSVFTEKTVAPVWLTLIAVLPPVLGYLVQKEQKA